MQRVAAAATSTTITTVADRGVSTWHGDDGNGDGGSGISIAVVVVVVVVVVACLSVAASTGVFVGMKHVFCVNRPVRYVYGDTKNIPGYVAKRERRRLSEPGGNIK